MKRHVVFASGLIVLTIGALAVSQPSAQFVPNTPYQTWPAWYQVMPSSTRFVILANMEGKAVFDRETGLVWEREPTLESSTWLDAHDRCNNLTIGTRQGWRLPTVQELTSLVDPSLTVAPRVPAGHPFTVVATAYWSSTEAASDSRFAWVGSFSLLFDSSPQNKLGTLFVWCVRGGQGANQQ